MPSFDFTTLANPVPLPIITANWFILNSWSIGGPLAQTTLGTFGLRCGTDRTIINLFGATDEFMLDLHNADGAATVTAEAPHNGGWISLGSQPIPSGHHFITLTGKSITRTTIVGTEIELKAIEVS